MRSPVCPMGEADAAVGAYPDEHHAYDVPKRPGTGISPGSESTASAHGGLPGNLGDPETSVERERLSVGFREKSPGLWTLRPALHGSEQTDARR